MNDLRNLVETHVGNGTVPATVAMVARGDRVEVEAAGPVERDSIFRIASIGKPMTAAVVMMLIDEGGIALDEPIAEWLPELAAPNVVRTPESPVEDVVPAARPITVEDLLTFRAGWGFPADFSLPAVQPLFSDVHAHMLEPPLIPAPNEWLAALSRVPMLHQPGEAWLYNTCSDIQGVLVARVTGRPFDEFLAERLFGPLGMTDTGFQVPPDKLDRFTSLHDTVAAGEHTVRDAPDGHWSRRPAFASGAGGLASTLDDCYAFARLLLDDGEADGCRLLSPASVRQMMTNHLTEAQRTASTLFLEGQGWGFGGSVDVEPADPWNVPGRYGWVGGTGTTLHVTPSTGDVAILLTQVMMTGPTPTPLMRAFWQYAASGT
jgi:CubicO group peptidase (beta-lactamase class C family)